MEEIDFFSLTPINQEASILTTSQRPESVNVKGSVLEKQFSLPNGWHLVLTTANSPYDEALYATLIDQNFKIADEVEISNALTPGMLENVKILDKNCLEFSFNQPAAYTLKVAPQGFMLPRTTDISKRPISSIFKRKYLNIFPVNVQ